MMRFLLVLEQNKGYNIRMFKNFFSRFFPTPKFLTVPSFGLDISDESVKYIGLTKKKTVSKSVVTEKGKFQQGLLSQVKLKIHDDWKKF